MTSPTECPEGRPADVDTVHHVRASDWPGAVSHDAPGAFLADRQVAKIQRIGCLQELDGYEAEARRRGFHPDELPALLEARKRLTPKKRKRR